MIRPTAHLFGFCPPEVKPGGMLALPAKLGDGQIVRLEARREFWRKAAMDLLAATAPRDDPAAPALKPSGRLL